MEGKAPDRSPVTIKGSYSIGNGECITVQPVKSSASIGNGDCVTSASAAGGGMLLWDSKSPESGAWELTGQQWDDFLTACEHGILSVPHLQEVELVRIPAGEDAIISVELQDDGTYTWRFTGSGVVHSFTREEMHAFWYGCIRKQIREGWMPVSEDGGYIRAEVGDRVLIFS